jgi:hypothetical protein
MGVATNVGEWTVQYNQKSAYGLVGLSALAMLGLTISMAGAQGSGPYYPVETTQAPAKPRAVKPAVKPQVASAGTEVPATGNASASTDAAKPAAGGGGYFIEFRSRHAVSYGHTYAVHGRVGQKITPKDVVGLHPATESSVPWMIGHIIPVISETGASDGDADEKYVSARYRVLLTKAEYARLLGFLDRHKSKSTFWHAAIYNCNAFVGDIARFVGLEAPSPFLYPKEFITELKVMNKGRSRVAATAPLYTATPQ